MSAPRKRGESIGGIFGNWLFISREALWEEPVALYLTGKQVDCEADLPTTLKGMENENAYVEM
jgi:hypothetical protein